MESFLVEVVKYTNGWVVVVVFALYVGLEIYRKYESGIALNKTLNILENSISSLIKDFRSDIRELTLEIRKMNTTR
jgi:hypothetical protein